MGWKAAANVLESVQGCFSKKSAALLWDCLEQLPHHPTIVEVGVEYGRSSSVILAWGLDNPCATLFIDARVFNDVERPASFEQLLRRLGYSVVVLDIHPAYNGPAWYGVSPTHLSSYHYAEGLSHVIAEALPQYRPHLVHIDGDHTAEGVGKDRAWLDLLHPGGCALFHDYRSLAADGQSTFPGYSEMIDDLTRSWEVLGLEDTLLAVRKPYDLP